MQNSNIKKEAKYLSCVSNLIYNYKFDSLFKISIISLILCKDNKVLNMRGKFNLIEDFFKNFKSILLANYLDFSFVFKSILLLEDSQLISIENDKIIVNRNPQQKIPNNISYKAINLCLGKINLLSQKSFLYEVLSNV